MDQCVFAPMRDPDFARPCFRYCRDKLVPVGVIGNDQRQFDTALPRPLLDRHPSRRHRDNGIIHTPRPRLLRRRRRRDDDLAFQLFFRDSGRFAQFPKFDAVIFVELAHSDHAAMKVYRRVIASEAEQHDDALSLAKRVGRDKMRALGKVFEADEKLGDLVPRFGMLENRKAECRFGHEDIASDGFERRRGSVIAAFIIAGYNDAAILMLQKYLCAAQYMPSRVVGDVNFALPDSFAIADFLVCLGGIRAVAALDDGDGFGRGQNVLVSGARMVCVTVCDKGAFHRKRGVDIRVKRTYIKIMAKQLHRKDISLVEKLASTGREKIAPLTGWLNGRGWDWFPHQLEVLDAAESGHNVLLCAPTGAGKTLGGFLPAFADLLGGRPRGKGIHTLYISPLKALTVDVHRNVGRPIEDLNLPITYETRTGDTSAAKRARQKTKPPDILMTTPESLALLLSYDNAGEYFSTLRYIIIDELHALLHSKRGDLLALGLSRLRGLAPDACRIGLSATIAEPELARDWLCGPNGVIVRAVQRVMPDITILKSDARVPWAGHMAIYAMPEIYKALTQSHMSIVFVNTRAQAELIFQALWKLNDKDLKIALHHGSLERELRRKVEAKMASGELDCVVATSSLDLGLDWAEVDLVVQIGAPKGVSRLLQRIGRSNHRLNEPSKALLVPTNRFEFLECIAAVDAISHRELDGISAKTGSLDVLAQHIFGRACSGPFDGDAMYGEVQTAWPYRILPRQDFDRVLRFVQDGGYALQAYERYRRLVLNEDGLYQLADPRMARQYRMNIGTIVESPMLRVKMGNRQLGQIEEFFINHLTPGDTFLFAGRIVRFDRLHDATVLVSTTKSDKPKIPSYDGGKLPLSTHLSVRVRELLENEANWDALPGNVGGWLKLQEEQSALPGMDRLLVESFGRRGRHFLVAYPFAGRNALQTLGFLIMRRMTRNGDKPLGFVATDYAIVITSINRPKDIPSLFSTDLLGEELHEWLDDTPLLKRTFRENAVIAGMIERRHPGQEKTGRQMTFSSDLIFDVLQKYEPDHVLLQAARQDATGGLIDTGRLSDMLVEMGGKLLIKELDHVSPLAVPMMLEIARESVPRKESSEYYMEELEEKLLEEAGLS